MLYPHAALSPPLPPGPRASAARFPYHAHVNDSSGPILLHTPGSDAQTCEIHVAPGLLASVGTAVRKVSRAARVMVVTDSTVAPLHLAPLASSLEAAGFQPVVHVLPAGEAHKHPATLLPAYERFLSAGIDRQTPLLALGGGVVGDMAGFVAATLLRGVPFVQVPTTLMAMVDSSIGGKTGVNQPGPQGGKNLIGAFHQPLLVLSDPLLLGTLPKSELVNGLAECIKHDAIADEAHLSQLAAALPRLFSRDAGVLTALVRHNAAIKASVVSQDPTERGIRAHLNFGHTFAHAFESVTAHAIPHGQAVGLGMVAAARLSADLGLLPEPQRDRLVDLVRKAGLTACASHSSLADHQALLAAMQRDKKTENGRLRFVLLQPLGKAVVRGDVPAEAVLRVLTELREI
jgi:3-dehydroquinate synthase